MAASSEPSKTKQLAFFETTPLKLAILSICTFGVYEMYWYYKMWRRAYPKASKFSAIIRALLSRLFLYELLKNQQVPYAIWLAIAYFALGFAIQLPTFWGVVLSYLTFVPLVYTQMHLNKRLKKPVKAPFTWRSITVALVGIALIILFFVVAGNYSASADQNNASTEPTAHHKVAQEKSTTDQAANQANTDQVSDSTQNNGAKPTSDKKSGTTSVTAPASSTTTAKTTSSGSPVASPSNSTIPSAPAVNPNATFSVVLNNGYKDQTTGHLITPFTIVHEAGHTKPVTASAYPSYGGGITVCKATLSGDSGVLEMWFTAPTSHGFYVCTIVATDGTTEHTADLPIDTYSD
ncbi:MAG TPA: hypothetical protein VJ843_05070 [Candidatus Saccharimonadales bacterium]|nr:hypothetical protein [Candidatus Saccharimonadales bacterium]